MTNLSIIRSIVVPPSIFVIGLLAGVMLGVAMEQQTISKADGVLANYRAENTAELGLKTRFPGSFLYCLCK
jgi:hypothetical protein